MAGAMRLPVIYDRVRVGNADCHRPCKDRQLSTQLPRDPSARECHDAKVRRRS